MVTTLTPELIRNRREMVKGQIRDAELTIVRLRSTLADLDAAERVFKLVNPQYADLFADPVAAEGNSGTVGNTVGKTAPPESGASFSEGNPFRIGTNKAFIWEVLNGPNEGRSSPFAFGSSGNRGIAGTYIRFSGV